MISLPHSYRTLREIRRLRAALPIVLCLIFLGNMSFSIYNEINKQTCYSISTEEDNDMKNAGEKDNDKKEKNYICCQLPEFRTERQQSILAHAVHTFYTQEAFLSVSTPPPELFG